MKKFAYTTHYKTLLGDVHTDLQEHEAENTGNDTGNERDQPMAVGKAGDDNDCDACKQGTYHVGGGICTDVAVPQAVAQEIEVLPTPPLPVKNR